MNWREKTNQDEEVEMISGGRQVYLPLMLQMETSLLMGLASTYSSFASLMAFYKLHASHLTKTILATVAHPW